MLLVVERPLSDANYLDFTFEISVVRFGEDVLSMVVLKWISRTPSRASNRREVRLIGGNSLRAHGHASFRYEKYSLGNAYRLAAVGPHQRILSSSPTTF